MREPVEKHGMKARIEKDDLERAKRRPGSRIALKAGLEIAIDGVEWVAHKTDYTHSLWDGQFIQTAGTRG